MTTAAIDRKLSIAELQAAFDDLRKDLAQRDERIAALTQRVDEVEKFIMYRANELRAVEVWIKQHDAVTRDDSAAAIAA